MIRLYRNIFIVLLFSALMSCGTSPKTNFYQLSSGRGVESNVTSEVSIGVWKVNLPELIDRPEIVTRTGPYTIDLADFDRWAGGLSSNVSLLLADELSHNLSTGHVDISPWSSYRNFDYQIKVHVRTFDGELGGVSTFEGVYVVLNGKGNKKLLEEAFSFKQKLKANGYSEMAEAMSQLVVSLAGKISASISDRMANKL